MNKVRLFLRRMRERNKEYFDEKRIIRREKLEVENLILL